MISITTYNCRGLPITNSELKKKPDLYQVLNEADIVLLQEIWLAKQMEHLSNIHEQFLGVGSYTTDFNEKLIHGHPPGGTAILCKRKSMIV